MAYLTFAGTEEKNSCFKFIGTSSTQQAGGLISSETSLISNNTSLILDSSDSGLDTCSFYSGPSDDTIMAFGETAETCGSIAYSSAETCGSIASAGGVESCGSIASSSSSSSSFSGGGCSYSC